MLHSKAEQTCPECGRPDLRPEGEGRYQCRNCGSRAVVGADGIARRWMDYRTAGKRGRAGRALGGKLRRTTVKSRTHLTVEMGRLASGIGAVPISATLAR